MRNYQVRYCETQFFLRKNKLWCRARISYLRLCRISVSYLVAKCFVSSIYCAWIGNEYVAHMKTRQIWWKICGARAGWSTRAKRKLTSASSKLLRLVIPSTHQLRHPEMLPTLLRWLLDSHSANQSAPWRSEFCVKERFSCNPFVAPCDGVSELCWIPLPISGGFLVDGFELLARIVLTNNCEVW